MLQYSDPRVVSLKPGRFFVKVSLRSACSSVVERCPDKTEVLGSIPSTRTTLEKSMPSAGEARARRPNRTDFSGQKEIPDSVRSRKEKF